MRTFGAVDLAEMGIRCRASPRFGRLSCAASARCGISGFHVLSPTPDEDPSSQTNNESGNPKPCSWALEQALRNSEVEKASDAVTVSAIAHLDRSAFHVGKQARGKRDHQAAGDVYRPLDPGMNCAYLHHRARFPKPCATPMTGVMIGNNAPMKPHHSAHGIDSLRLYPW